MRRRVLPRPMGCRCGDPIAVLSLAWAKISWPLLLLISGLDGAGVVENHGDGDRIAASIGVRILRQKSGFWPRGAMEAGVV